MRVLVYEWCSSGGLTGPDAARLVPRSAAAADLEPLAREGRAMFLALLHDGCRDHRLQLHAVVDEHRPLPLPEGVRRIDVPPAAELDRLVHAARGCEAAVIVAPETGGILARRVAAVRAGGVDVIAPGPRFLELAADKQATILALAAAGVPVPAGRRLEAGAPWPAAFVRPAVAKRLDGVGCDGLTFVGRDGPLPAAAGHPRRIEAALHGVPVGVSCIAGCGRTEFLPAMSQRFSGGVSPGYSGGEPVVEEALRQRALQLAARSVAALARAAGEEARGWLGVDMILGPREDGRSDRVLEVNPRLTTSFLGHAAAAGTSLLSRILTLQPAATIHPEPRSFDLVAHAPP